MRRKNYFLQFLGFVLFAFFLAACSPEEPMVVPDDMEEEEEEEEEPPPEERTYITEEHTVGDLSIEIYVPSDYIEGTSYPTIYFNDGDFLAEVFGSWTGLEADPFIMVGVWDTNDRATRFSAYEDDRLTEVYGEYTPGAVTYTEALINEVIPFVENKYKSTKKALMGISLGGLHATWAGIYYPGEFSFIGAISPAYWVGNHAILDESVEHLRPVGISSSKVFYLDRGTAEWRNFLPLVENLKSVELVYGQNIFYYEVVGADHDVPFWVLRAEVPFRLFMEGPGELDDMVVTSYCVENLDVPGTEEERINPIAKYDNGVEFSVISAADFEVVTGSGEVMVDGTFTVNSGTTISVDCSYMGITKRVQATVCN